MSTLEAARGRVAAFAALITAVVVCAGDAVARNFPFGPTTRSVSDLGNQFIPYHAHLWDLLHGKADGGILLNWQSGYGSSMLPDLGTYLTSPFALLVGLFPRDRIDLAVYVITVLKMATAAAAMTMLAAAPGPGEAALAVVGGRVARLDLRDVRLVPHLRLVQPDVAGRPDRVPDALSGRRVGCGRRNDRFSPRSWWPSPGSPTSTPPIWPPSAPRWCCCSGCTWTTRSRFGSGCGPWSGHRPSPCSASVCRPRC